MRWVVIIFLLVVIRSFGQEKGAESAKTRRPTDSLSLPALEKLDSLAGLANRHSDSLVAAIQRAKQKRDSADFVPAVAEKYRSDVVSFGVAAKGKFDSLLSNMHCESYLDSIIPSEKLNDYTAKLAGLKSKLTSKTDSSSKFSFADSMKSHDIGRLKSKLDTVNRLRPPRAVQQTNEKLETLNQKISGKADTIRMKINEKSGMFSENGGNLPGGFNLPAINVKSPASIDPSINIHPELTSPDIIIPTVKNPLENMEVPTDVPNIGSMPHGSMKIPEIPDAKINDIKLPEDISDIQDKLSGLTEAQEKIGGYQQDLAKIREGDLTKLQEIPDAIESKVENLEELKPLEEASQEFAAIKAKWNDPQVLKELALNKAKETAINHFAGHEEELKAAMDRLSKLKAKIPDPEGALDLFAKRQQFMKAKPIAERFVPGLSMQFQKQESFWLDLNPHVGFKISGRCLAGLGWNERLAYTIREHTWDKENRIYGVRTFLNFKLKNNLWLKAEAENMNAPVRATPLMAPEIVGRDWIWSYFAGIKKDIQFSKYVKVHVQTLYNIYNPDKRSPYTDRLNVRIGFEFPMKSHKSKGKS